MKIKQIGVVILTIGLLTACSVSIEEKQTTSSSSHSTASSELSSSQTASSPPPVVLEGPLATQLDLSRSGDALLNEAACYFTIPELDEYEQTELIGFEDGKIIFASGRYGETDDRTVYSYEFNTNTLKKYDQKLYRTIFDSFDVVTYPTLQIYDNYSYDRRIDTPVAMIHIDGKNDTLTYLEEYDYGRWSYYAAIDDTHFAMMMSNMFDYLPNGYDYLSIFNTETKENIRIHEKIFLDENGHYEVYNGMGARNGDIYVLSSTYRNNDGQIGGRDAMNMKVFGQDGTLKNTISMTQVSDRIKFDTVMEMRVLGDYFIFRTEPNIITAFYKLENGSFREIALPQNSMVFASTTLNPEISKFPYIYFFSKASDARYKDHGALYVFDMKTEKLQEFDFSLFTENKFFDSPLSYFLYADIHGNVLLKYDRYKDSNRSHVLSHYYYIPAEAILSKIQ